MKKSSMLIQAGGVAAIALFHPASMYAQSNNNAAAQSFVADTLSDGTHIANRATATSLKLTDAQRAAIRWRSINVQRPSISR